MTSFNQTIIDMWIDYVNNFLTVEKFAEYYDISVDFAKAIIKEASQNNN